MRLACQVSEQDADFLRSGGDDIRNGGNGSEDSAASLGGKAADDLPEALVIPSINGDVLVRRPEVFDEGNDEGWQFSLRRIDERPRFHFARPFGSGSLEIVGDFFDELLRVEFLWGITLEHGAAGGNPAIVFPITMVSVRLHRGEGGIVADHDVLEKPLEIRSLPLVALHAEDHFMVVVMKLGRGHVWILDGLEDLRKD